MADPYGWAPRLIGCTLPDANKVEPGTILKCPDEGCPAHWVVVLEESDPGPYHAYGNVYATFHRVRWYDRSLKKRIESGDVLLRTT